MLLSLIRAETPISLIDLYSLIPAEYERESPASRQAEAGYVRRGNCISSFKNARLCVAAIQHRSFRLQRLDQSMTH